MAAPAGDPGSFAALVRVLSTGGVAIIPCDTIYGIVGAAPQTEERIRSIKGRETRPFLQLIAEASWVARLSDAEVPAALAKHWPGPLTIVLAARGGGTVALRVPDSSFLRELLLAVDAPLYSTSVNRSGMPPMNRIAEIRQELESEVDLVIDAGDLLSGVPSTLVDATSRPCRILRQGALVLPPGDLL